MGRTAESYLKEAGAKPIESLYTFSEWTDDHIANRMVDLFDQKDRNKLSGERERQVSREIAHLIFEATWRSQHE